MEPLTSLVVSDCTRLTNLNLEHLTSLEFKECENLSDFSFLGHYKNLTYLNLSYCSEDSNLNFLERKESYPS